MPAVATDVTVAWSVRSVCHAGTVHWAKTVGRNELAFGSDIPVTLK